MKIFRHLESGNIEIINGGESVYLTLDQFQKYEPTYSLPLNAVSQYYEPGVYRCVKTSDGSGYPLNPNWTDGDRFIDRLQDFNVLLAYELQESLDSVKDGSAVKKRIDPILARKSEYPSISDLVIALWERIVENDNMKTLALQEQREAVKKKYPKSKRKK